MEAARPVALFMRRFAGGTAWQARDAGCLGCTDGVAPMGGDALPVGGSGLGAV